MVELVAHGGFERVEAAGAHQGIVQGVGPEGPNSDAKCTKQASKLKQKSSSHEQNFRSE
ncbi:hypothetical protein GCM10022409_18190 [Hymenobacter glaciei]|uniref:Uncharacterized protein n=1 Tax=Hymenobacter glaciei TaxID=877209 RepID=A0ABP7U176_9BACT